MYISTKVSTYLLITLTNLFPLLDLCSFTETGKSFKKQDMYYCHTCKFANGEGICTNCVKKCHVKHNVKYAGFVNGFCDCGVKGEGKCKALSIPESPKKLREITNTSPVKVISIKKKTFSVGTQTQEFQVNFN